MKNLLFASLFLVGCLATANTAHAGSRSIVWHHSTPIYTGKSAPHGLMMSPQSTHQRLRGWYGTQGSRRQQVRHTRGFRALFGR